MKIYMTCNKKRILSVLMALLFLLIPFNYQEKTSAIAAQKTSPNISSKGINETFNDNKINGWKNNNAYKLTEAYGALKIDINKIVSPYAMLSYAFSSRDLSTNPYLSLKIKVIKDMTLNIGVNDSAGNSQMGDDALTYELITSKYYSVYTFNLKSFTSINLKKITSIDFYFDFATTDCITTAYFEDLRIGKDAVVSPSITTIPEQQTYINAPEQTVYFRGVKDATNGKHTIRISARSLNTQLISRPTIIYKPNESTGILKYKVVPNKFGRSSIIVNTSAAGDPSANEMKFDVLVEKNLAPRIEKIQNQLAQAGLKYTIKLKNIDDGNPNARQSISITATSSNPQLIPNPQIVYKSDDQYGFLNYQPILGKTGKATITLNLKDNGGTVANGVNTKSISFDVNVLKQVNKPPTIAQADNVFLTEGDGIKTLDINLTNISSGDATTTQAVSLKVKSSNTRLIPDPELDYVSGASTGKLTITPVKGETGKTDITVTVLDNGGTLENNGNVATVMTFEVDVKPNPVVITENPQVTMDAVHTLSIAENSEAQKITLSGISNGNGDINNVVLTGKCSDDTLISKLSVSKVSNGFATLMLTPVENKIGNANITITASMPGSKSMDFNFDIEVLKVDDKNTARVTLNVNNVKQEMDGFGAYMYTPDGNYSKETVRDLIKYSNDIGLTIARIGIIPIDFEPTNDNSNPNVTNYSAYNKNALSFSLINQLKAKTGIKKFILSIWSPPGWMKANKGRNYYDVGLPNSNSLMPCYYEEYAEYLIALIKTFKNMTGSDLYAISLQNEPYFNEPYPSAILTPTACAEVLSILIPKIKKEGLTTKIYLPEILSSENGVEDFLTSLSKYPEAMKYVDIVGTHNYDLDGIKVGGPAANTWNKIYIAAQKYHPMKTWMTETSGHANTCDGAMELAGHMYTALNDGNVSAWVWWGFIDQKSSEVYSLVADGIPEGKYYVSKQFYKFIRPGAQRIEAKSSDENVLSLAFKNRKTKRLTVVLINSSNVPKRVSVSSNSMPNVFEKYESLNNRYFVKCKDITNGTVVLQPYSITTLDGGINPLIN